MSNKPEKEAKNEVHQNAIWRETIKKELKNATLTLNTTFSVNPYHKMHTITEKPNDGRTNDVNAEKEPYKKYDFPMTEAQEVGWFHKPLVETDRHDSRLNFPRHNSEITKYMNAAWRLKEQTENLQ